MKPRDEEYESEEEYDGSDSLSKQGRGASGRMKLRRRKSKRYSLVFSNLREFQPSFPVFFAEILIQVWSVQRL